MKEYDVLIVGGGVAGSVAAKFAAKGGLKTLFIEKKKTPRNKPCSGIQFNYLEKIIGEKVPPSRLCNNQLDRIEMHFPNGRHVTAPFAMLNFMRKPFDDWLNTIAKEYGAEFRDECEYVRHDETSDHVVVTVRTGGKPENDEQVKARYLVEATGLMPAIRKIIRPCDFSAKYTGGALNYYINGTADLNPRTLYQFWNIEWNNTMFAWAYNKTLDDGKDYWVVGTGCNDSNIKERQEAFYKHVKEKFHVEGEIVKKEGYTVTIDLLSKDRVWLGRERVLATGDAAGLIDTVRGVGMDAAALSGRLVAKAILKADKNGTNALDEYSALMKRVVKQTRDNQKREIGEYKTNDELQAHLNKHMAKTGIGMFVQSFLNVFRSAEQQKLLPP
nr:NAD(P)/FAD-dependent oxidoreductase [Candidatus Sigynarchaeum springense]